jgi:hypothetical protein
MKKCRGRRLGGCCPAVEYLGLHLQLHCLCPHRQRHFSSPVTLLDNSHPHLWVTENTTGNYTYSSTRLPQYPDRHFLLVHTPSLPALVCPPEPSIISSVCYTVLPQNFRAIPVQSRSHVVTFLATDCPMSSPCQSVLSPVPSILLPHR